MDSVDRLRSELLTGFHIKAKAAQEKDRTSQVDEAVSSMEHVLKRLTVELQKQRYRNFGMYR